MTILQCGRKLGWAGLISHTDQHYHCLAQTLKHCSACQISTGQTPADEPEQGTDAYRRKDLG